ncbi:HNH endonuclease [Paenisporosarcina sp. TG-14]|uniref:HNH endonuclease n=1 Tax=Paenisporosarcina sp. TG-14 TaxID=1231057 RepID=UPI0003030C81|nr:HNH endonuclease [Paenisporosarcina sp. TG-14]
MNEFKVPAIRVMPMSEKDATFNYYSIEDMQNWFEVELPNLLFQYKSKMDTPIGTLVLFQYKNCLVASALLREISIYNKRTENGYNGFYIFDPLSITIFKPITSEEMKVIWRNFKGFNQSMQKLSTDYYNDFKKLIVEKNMRLVDVPLEDEEVFQEKIEKIKIKSSIIIVDQSRNIPSKNVKAITSSWGRNIITAKSAVVNSGYTCEYDSTHVYFISKISYENYVEAHHLIPMEFQDEFSNSIDVEANILSLCPLCHKRVHHATKEDIRPMIEKLYIQRRDRLLKCKIDIELDRLMDFY